MSRVTVAQSAGFCFGVRRAVDLAEREAAKHQTLYSYGEIIHNTHETRRLEKLGVRTAECTADIPDGAAVLIRAHGVTRAVYEELEAKGCTVYDAAARLLPRFTGLSRQSPRLAGELSFWAAKTTRKYSELPVGVKMRRFMRVQSNFCRLWTNSAFRPKPRSALWVKPHSIGQVGIFL